MKESGDAMVMEWYALSKFVMDRLKAQGIAEKYLRLIPFAVAAGMQGSLPTSRTLN